MTRRSPRPFTLADLMALIAALALGFPLARWVGRPIEGDLEAGDSFAYIGGHSETYPFALWGGAPACHAVALAAMLAALRWRGPRPSAARIARQPGAVACLATLGAILVGALVQLVEGAIEVRDPGGFPYFLRNDSRWDRVIGWVPVAIAGAWAGLAMARRWSPERSWVDRLGRALGAYWLAWIPVRSAIQVLSLIFPP